MAAVSMPLTIAAPTVEAKVVRLEIVRTEPAFGGQSFGAVGAYQRVFARAHGEVDPASPLNAIIQDLELAPRNARGRVEYTTDVEFLKPVDMARGNGTLLFEVLNRGNKLAVNAFNNGIPLPVPERNALTTAGDGHLFATGHTLVWFGWQADVLPGASRLTLSVPTARNADGSPITGLVRAELTTAAPTRTLNLSSGWFTGLTHASYATASTAHRTAFPDGFVPTMTVRAKEQDRRQPVDATEWAFGSCPDGTTITPSETQICLRAGFQPGRLYELIYRAKDPTVTGLGFAAMRDLADFLRTQRQDEVGTANPVHREGARTLVFGSSQSGRMIRSFIHLGFNHAEGGGRAFDGAFPHIGGGLMPLNVRFGQPGRAWGDQVDHLFPAYDFPFSYARQHDPLTGRTQGVLDRCEASATCPRIFHVATALEIWEGRQSLGFTDPLGSRDVPDPNGVRTYIMASTQHGAWAAAMPTQAPFGNCQQQPNPNPQRETMRALLAAFTAWIRDDVPPPASAIPRIADGSLVAPHQVRFPAIPANGFGGVTRPAVRALRVHNPLQVLDFGPGFRPGDSSGVISIEPPRAGTASYGVLMPQVDADGNDVAGVRSVHLQVPVGTYTGWNLGRADRFEDGFCSLSGSFVAFAATRAERLAAGDTRPSLEERYPTNDAYVAAVRRAADGLVAQGFLLRVDADSLIAQAEKDGVRKGP
ncbi:MAG: hypothetical protein FJX57_14265 [Alphaproteobacteria bacterium]|nr:hypothetical protein [Alphaproteobacteria bacterium]